MNRAQAIRQLFEAFLPISPQDQEHIAHQVHVIMNIYFMWSKYAVNYLQQNQHMRSIYTTELVRSLNNTPTQDNGVPINFSFEDIEIEDPYTPIFIGGMATSYLSPTNVRTYGITLRVPKAIVGSVLLSRELRERLYLKSELQLRDFLTHEWTHTYQYRRTKEVSPLGRSSLVRHSGATSMEKYQGRPEELMAYAAGFAQRFHAIKTSSSPHYSPGGIESKENQYSDLAISMRVMMEDIRYGSPAYKLFLRHFISAMQSYGYHPENINAFIGRALRGMKR